MRIRDVGRLCILTLLATALSSCSSHHHGYVTRTHCSGEVCIRTIAAGLTVGDVIGYYAPAGDSLTGQSWRLVLTTHSCNPQRGHAAKCLPTGTFPGPLQHGMPPAYASCKTHGSGPAAMAPTCPTHMAEELASHGDWGGFFEFAKGTGAHTFARKTWLCIAPQLLVNGTWSSQPSSGSVHRSFACSEVSA